MRLVARNNEVLATKRTSDAEGLVALRAELDARRGRPGARAAGRRSGKGDYAFLSLKAPGVRPDRTAASRAGASPAGLDAFVYTERGVYRTGETVSRDGAAARREGRSPHRTCP